MPGINDTLQAAAGRQGIEETLQQSQERFRLLVEGAQDYAIILLDPQGRVTTWNAGAERITGYQAGEILGEHLSRFYPPDAIDRRWPQHALEVARTAGRFEEEAWRVRRDGSRFWASVTVMPMFAGDGMLSGFSKITRDLTERRIAEERLREVHAGLERRVQERTAELARANDMLQTEIGQRQRLESELQRRLASLHESEQRFARFMQHLPGLAWIKDLEGRYVYVNDAAEKAFCTPRSRLYGQTDAEIFPPEAAEQFIENDRRVLTGGTEVRVIETLMHDDGVAHHSLVSKFPIPGPDGKPALIGGIAIDVTDRLQAEQALKDADRKKDEFLAMLGHELRNPLAGILNGIDVLDQIEDPAGEAAEIRAVIARQAAHMSRMVDDLLDLARIMRGKIVLKKQRLDLVRLVREVVEDHRRAIESQGARLGLQLPDFPLWSHGDATRLSQALVNLLANATKFLGGPGDVTVEMWDDPRRRRAVITVRDTGMGMDAATLRHVFEPFMQAERTLDRSGGGLGLGLALVKGVIELHGGRVLAASAGVGRGSQFTIELSTCSDDEPSVAPSAADWLRPAARSAARRRILLIDDRRDAILPAKKMLELAGHEVFTAGDGPSGMALAREIRPDAILCDIGLPDGMNGYDVAAAIRAEPVLREVYLVALSGYGQEEDRERARAAGFDHHLTKPVSMRGLETLLTAFPRFPDRET
jgi:PAS domain S-box-containing protein